MKKDSGKALLGVLFAGTLLFTSIFSLYGQDASPKALEFYERGLVRQSDEDWFGAAEDFHEALRANPSYGDAWFHLAEVTYELNDFNLALTYLDSADKYAKDRLPVLNLKGLTLISLGRLDEARSVFEDMLKRYPNDVTARFGLAELDLFDGRWDGAKSLYIDALKRQQNNRKALLSLALLSSETGNETAAQNYLNQALRYHSGEAEVHYLASYLDAKAGDLVEAERRARAAVQIDSDYTKAYVLLASLLYSQARYDEVIDIADYLIGRDRNTTSAWYLKGISQYRLGNTEGALATYNTGLTIHPEDEVMRAALELLVFDTIALEDSRRSQWSTYHIKKAKDYSKIYQGPQSRYEYQRALRLEPQNHGARKEFAEMLDLQGLHELYVDQLKFISDNQKEEEKKTVEGIKVSDTIEAYDSLLKNSLNAKWGVEPFYLDKNRWNVGFYYLKSPVQLRHVDAEEIIARMAKDVFSGISTTSVTVKTQPVTGFAEAYRLARTTGMDYFVMLTVDETEREISLSATVFSARTGTETTHFTIFRTGNDRLASLLQSFRRSILDLLPVRGKIISRSVNDVLVDLGKTDGMVKDAVLDVIKGGKITTADSGTGVTFDEKKDKLGEITLTSVGEEIAEGQLSQTGFYDRVNVGDEVLVKFIPKQKEGEGVPSDTVPAAGEDGKRVLAEESVKKLTAEEMGLVKTPAIIELIRSLH